MMSKLWELLAGFFQIGLFSIGGGYAIIPMIRQEVVERAGWLSMREFTDIITISQMTPGPLAVNASTFVGARIAGLPGALVATFGCVISGVLIALSLYRFFSGNRESRHAMAVLGSLRAASVGLIAGAGATILLLALFGTDAPEHLSAARFDAVAFALFCAGVYVLRRYRLNPIALMLLCGAAGAIAYA